MGAPGLKRQEPEAPWLEQPGAWKEVLEALEARTTRCPPDCWAEAQGRPWAASGANWTALEPLAE